MSNHKVTIDGVEYVRSEKALKEALHKADAELIAALNGVGRTVATEVEAADLRRALLRARADCREAGVEAETLLEFAERTRREDEEDLRAYAKQVSIQNLGMVRPKRVQLAWTAGGLAGVATAGCFWTPGGLLAGLLVAMCVYASGIGWLANRYPTAGVLVGRRAFERHLGNLDLWPRRSDNDKDYDETYRRLAVRARLGGKSDRWIKAR